MSPPTNFARRRGIDPETRFLAKTEPTPSGCWLWRSAIDVAGYGRFAPPRPAGTMAADRWSYGHFIGPVPDGAEIEHTCQVRACVNPEHLRLTDRRPRKFRPARTNDHGTLSVYRRGCRCDDCKSANRDASRLQRVRQGCRAIWDATPLDRFLDKIELRLDSACWYWIGAVGYNGYGKFGEKDRKNLYAHRWSYEYFVGPIPDGLHLDHLCRVRNCVNPEHLEPVTPAENVRRAVSARKATR